jgi:hypothetical protein
MNAAAEEFRGIDPANLVAMISDQDNIIAEMKGALNAPQRDADATQQRRLQQKQRAARHRQYVIERRLALDFGTARGWTLSPSPFGLITLGRGKQHAGGRRDDEGNGYFRGDIAHCFDHPFWYRRGRNVAAIATHLYAWPHVRPQCQMVANRFGLAVEAPDFPSWYSPGGTTLVVYSAAA